MTDLSCLVAKYRDEIAKIRAASPSRRRYSENLKRDIGKALREGGSAAAIADALTLPRAVVAKCNIRPLSRRETTAHGLQAMPPQDLGSSLQKGVFVPVAVSAPKPMDERRREIVIETAQGCRIIIPL